MYFLLYSLIFEKKLQRFLPFVFLVWANTHAEFVIGLFIYGVYTLAQLIGQIKARKLQLKELVYPVASVAATLINIYGIELWITLAKELTLPVKSYVQEWSYMSTKTLSDSITLGFIIALFLVGGVAYKKPGKWYTFLVFFFLVFSVKSVYMARVFFMVCSIGLIVSVDTLMAQFANYFSEQNKKIIHKAVIFFSILFFAALTGNFAYKLWITSSDKNWGRLKRYPYDAVVWIQKSNIQGNILNNYDWGGYMIWKLPQYKTFIDGRMTSWRDDGKYFMKDYYVIMRLKDETSRQLLNNYIRTYNIKIVLEDPKTPMITYLKSLGWATAYEDKLSIVLVAPDLATPPTALHK
jgi:hypothetical protein